MGQREQEVSREELAITLFEESGDALFLFEPDTEELIDVNPAAERLSGFFCRELLRMQVTYLFRSSVQGGLNRLRQAFKTTGLFHSQEDFFLRHKTPDRWIPVNLTATRLHTRAKTLGLITARDISECRRLEDKIIRMAAIVNSSQDAIMSESLDGTIESWNPAAERMYGYAAEEVIGKEVALLIPPEHLRSLYTRLDRLGQGEVIAPFEEKRRRKDGNLIPVSISQSAIRDRQGKIVGAAAIHRNIEERLRLEEEVRQAQKMEAIGRLAGGVAHDFNNQLAVISGYSALLLERCDVDVAARDMMEEIRKAGERSASLTAQLLAFSRKQVLGPKVLNLNERVEHIQQMLRRLIGEDISLTIDLDPDLGNVEVDPGQIDQVIINLAVNARDAMPQGGALTVHTANIFLEEAYEERHSPARAGRYVLLAVSDTGIGMDEKTRTSCLEPFFTTKGPGKGTGLGLSVVHGLVAQSGGHITVSSALGRGTTFKIFLPQIDKPRSTKTSLPEIKKTPRGSETVLLVEDEEAVRKFARNCLKLAGYTVLEAENGEAGLRVADNYPGPIHLLVSDVVMPGMGGRLLAERLTARRLDTKVLFMSGYADDAVVRPPILGSEINFLQKPFSPGDLAQKVREILLLEKDPISG
jgi:PAS domain S-box-containing protein